MIYKDIAQILKVLADPSRLEILDLLSCEELCGHDLLGHFEFSQPTLSHHMKALLDSHLITMRKEGNKRIYRLNHGLMSDINQHLKDINTASTHCICHDIDKGECDS
ncbi:metalloregulator ArsR/SmtB family transcription factor [Staphylococcus sp. ACRSN]|uniref:ArsR/SmtB family transcription factor n=1 Tax=Staphylococcus sp. ACRSN TaxID=2918214 RepID=UPI001EF23017|nr:metalloregulator ArsR/SmtB family transcription factor [Staphylococcus sp. ACRSN]MCG7339361.1 metalloregulator ArsR/SmtB family transcription factor [Staphylococcus sp. ACRSN]